TITLDKAAMEDVNVSYETKVRLKLKATTRTVLKKLLADHGLTYVIKDERIHVTTPDRAKAITSIRKYYVGDLAATVNTRYGPIASQIQMAQLVQNLMQTIVSTIEPQSWQVNNPDAPGTITFDPLSMSLVVKQTAEVHFSLAGFR